MRSKETLICIVAVALLVYSLTGLITVRRELEQMTAEAAEAERELTALEIENAALLSALENGVSEETMQQLAREKLALVLPGERVFYFLTDREE